MSAYEKAKRRRIEAPEWKKQLAKELLRPKRNRFDRRHIYSPSIDDTWTADLADFGKYKRVNRGYRYILVVLDTWSRYAFARPLKRKTGAEVANAFQDILQKSKRRCKKLFCDRGTEFYNVYLKHVLAANGNIQLYSTYNEPKASIAERFIRTLRSKIESNYILTQSTVWYDILPQLIHEYNTTRHRTIKMTPEEASKPENSKIVYENLMSRKESVPSVKFVVGDKVRISVHKRLFEKGATANWSEEVYEVSEILPTRPTTYKLRDLAGEDIQGAFYNEQLQKTDLTIYRIDKILRKRRRPGGVNEVFVRWSGYPDKFNQWIPADSVHKSGTDIQNLD